MRTSACTRSPKRVARWPSTTRHTVERRGMTRRRPQVREPIWASPIFALMNAVQQSANRHGRAGRQGRRAGRPGTQADLPDPRRVSSTRLSVAVTSSRRRLGPLRGLQRSYVEPAALDGHGPDVGARSNVRGDGLRQLVLTASRCWSASMKGQIFVGTTISPALFQRVAEDPAAGFSTIRVTRIQSPHRRPRRSLDPRHR